MAYNQVHDGGEQPYDVQQPLIQEDLAPNYRVQTTGNYSKQNLLGEPSNKKDQSNPPVKKRAESLATRGDIDIIQLVEKAKEKCRMPMKLSFENICFEV